jgi:hypothetical protein
MAVCVTGVDQNRRRGEGTWTNVNPAASISFSMGAAGHQS